MSASVDILPTMAMSQAQHSARFIKRHKGFTLIEALVAMFIFAWISLAAYQILDQVVIAQEVNQRKSAAVARTQRLSWQLASDFRQMVNRPVWNGQGNRLDPLLFESGDYLIEFTQPNLSQLVTSTGFFSACFVHS